MPARSAKACAERGSSVEHAREVVDGLVEVLLRPVHRAAIGECLRERRVDADGLAEIQEGAIVIEQRDVRDAPLRVRDGKIAPPCAARLDDGRTDADGDFRIGMRRSAPALSRWRATAPI